MKRTGLTRKTGLEPSAKPMRQRSKKTAAFYRNERAPLVKRLLEEHPACQRCDRERSTDVHEIVTRSRAGRTEANLLDESNLAVLGPACHRWVHDHPKEAEAEGWLSKPQPESENQ